MNITSAKYQTDPTSSSDDNVSVLIIVEGQELSVPIDTANRHYQAILEWVADGNTITDAD